MLSDVCEVRSVDGKPLRGSVMDMSFTFRLHRMAQSSAVAFTDLLLVCCLTDAACAVVNIVTAPVFIILIVSQSHAFFLVVAVRASFHAPVAVAVISCFQQATPDAMVNTPL